MCLCSAWRIVQKALCCECASIILKKNADFQCSVSPAAMIKQTTLKDCCWCVIRSDILIPVWYSTYAGKRETQNKLVCSYVQLAHFACRWWVRGRYSKWPILASHLGVMLWISYWRVSRCQMSWHGGTPFDVHSHKCAPKSLREVFLGECQGSGGDA